MIFDDTIPDPAAKAQHLQQRAERAMLVHDANKLSIHAFDSLKKKPDESGGRNHVASFVLARHAIEMTDAVGVLIASGCAEPAQTVLRSTLEAAFGVSYIVKADSDRRCIAYQVAHTNTKIKKYLKYDPRTPQGKQFATEMQNDPLSQGMSPPPYDFPKLIRNLEAFLALPEIAPIEQEWQCAKRSNKSDPHWYSLFSGPTNMRELAKVLDKRSEYEYLYGYWSNKIHAGDAMSQIRGITVGGKNQPIFLPVRNPENLHLVTSLAVSLSLMVTTALIEKYSPELIREFANRYISEIQGRYCGLQQTASLIKLPWSQ